MRSPLFLCLLLLGGCEPAAPTASQISVHDAWARETAPGQTSAAIYLTIVNSGSEADKLIGVTAPRAAMAMLHQSANRDGVIAMRMTTDLMVPGSQTVTLAPLGSHIMLNDLNVPLRVGERVALTLRFARSGQRQVDAAVLPAGSAGPGG